MQPISPAPEQDAKTETDREQSSLQDSPQLQTWSAPHLVKLAGEDAESGGLNGPSELPGPEAVS
jgi:hypothetical protein